MFGCVRESKIMKNNCIPQQIANRDLATDSNRNTDQNGTQCPHTASPPSQPINHSCSPSQSDPESTVPDQKSQIKIQKSVGQPSTLDPRPSTPCPGPSTINSNNYQPSTGSESPASSNTTAAQGSSDSSLPTINSNNHQPSTLVPYRLRRGLGFWQVTFAGQEAVIKHEQGLNYIAYLLLNPPTEPIHGLALAMKSKDSCVTGPGISEISDPLTGETVVVSADSVFQERGLSLDDAEAARSLRAEIQKLEAIVDNEATSEPVREEVLRELKEIYAHEKKSMPRVRNASQKAVRAVRVAMKRFHAHLLAAAAVSTDPSCWVLIAFADHIHKHILVPSARFSAPEAIRARKELASRFTYEPPKGVVWTS